jgi:hypothetical protein
MLCKFTDFGRRLSGIAKKLQMVGPQCINKDNYQIRIRILRFTCEQQKKHCVEKRRRNSRSEAHEEFIFNFEGIFFDISIGFAFLFCIIHYCKFAFWLATTQFLLLTSAGAGVCPLILDVDYPKIIQFESCLSNPGFEC